VEGLEVLHDRLITSFLFQRLKQFESHPREMEKWECGGFGFKSHDANAIFPTLHMRTRLRIRPEVRSNVRTPQTGLGPKDGEERCAGILADCDETKESFGTFGRSVHIVVHFDCCSLWNQACYVGLHEQTFLTNVAINHIEQMIHKESKTTVWG
jgi:hypothetical protein